MTAAYAIDFKDHHPPPPSPVDDLPAPREALEQLLEEIRAIDPRTFAKLNVPVDANVITVIGFMSKHMRRLAEDGAKTFIGFDRSQFERLVVCAQALKQAHVNYRGALKPRLRVDDAMSKLRRLREVMVMDLKLMEKRGVTQPEVLRTLQRANGPKNLLGDMMVLCEHYRIHWSRFSGQGQVTEQELAAANRLCTILDAALCDLAGSKDSLPEATTVRLGAFTLFYRAYDDARRTIAYLRWKEKDAEKFLPSLFAGRGRRKKKEEEGEVETVAPQVLPAPIDLTRQIGAGPRPAEPHILEGEWVQSEERRPPLLGGGTTEHSTVGLPGDMPFDGGFAPPRPAAPTVSRLTRRARRSR